MENEATLVTGGAGGIGSGIVQRLIEEGQRVIVLDQHQGTNEKAIHEVVDLSDPRATKEALARICAQHNITRLVNNAAFCRVLPLDEDDVENLEHTAAVNLFGAVLCTQAVLPAMTRAGFGRIVNISSRGAFGKESRLSYNATKAGINTLTRTWALEFASRGITVNAVAPGVVDAGMYKRSSGIDPALTHRTNESIPMKRLGKPEDVAEAVAFFLSERNTYITGQLLFVCGGLSIGRQPSI